MDLGTTLAIVVPNLVAAIAIVAGWRQHAQGIREGRRLSDLDNVRSVLDDAAVALHKAAYALNDIRMALTEHGRAFFATEERAKPYRALRRDGEQLDALAERLKVRFGREHELVTAFARADEAVLAIFRALELIRLEPPATSGDQYAEAQIEAMFREQVDVISNQREDFDAARSDFLDTAHRAAGAQLSD
jgi:hypothetical protein